MMRYGRVDDGTMEFKPAPIARGAAAAGVLLEAAREAR
jgi:hypothetical protein